MNESDLIQAIQDAMQQATEDDGGLKFEEIKELTGMGRTRLRRAVRQLVADGEMLAYRANRPNVAGERSSCIVYRLL